VCIYKVPTFSKYLINFNKQGVVGVGCVCVVPILAHRVVPTPSSADSKKPWLQGALEEASGGLHRSWEEVQGQGHCGCALC
jgi:hypothetical protein